MAGPSATEPAGAVFQCETVFWNTDLRNRHSSLSNTGTTVDGKDFALIPCFAVKAAVSHCMTRERTVDQPATYRNTPIPGTTVFTGPRSQHGYRINKLAMSLTGPDNRDRLKPHEQA